MTAPTTRLASIMNVSIRACSPTLALLTQNALVSNIKLLAAVCLVTQVVHLNDANASNAVQTMNVQAIVHVSTIIV